MAGENQWGAVVRSTGPGILALPLSGCMALDKALHLSGRGFPIYEKEVISEPR